MQSVPPEDLIRYEGWDPPGEDLGSHRGGGHPRDHAEVHEGGGHARLARLDREAGAFGQVLSDPGGPVGHRRRVGDQGGERDPVRPARL